MLTGRRSIDKNRPNGEHNLVEWARPFILDRRMFYRIIDHRLEGHFSIKGAQKAVQLAAQCLARDPKSRPMIGAWIMFSCGHVLLLGGSSQKAGEAHGRGG
ncbi:serine/threonine-protein kinase PBL34-like [Arachis stenosperma]|uniref:serine/threonine-protein kinase PBL34-like n=1 Tax=Arachis stenosperma TaxID=217475 RepID=UPI0025AB912A|nr:serine/threonine-protein kinase PBL34-like [Arachis stenosperma]